MWTCPKCDRVFDREGQRHSCKKIPLEQHFAGKTKAKELFEYLVVVIEKEVGQTKTISLPCCVHLFGHYDFLAALPKKHGLEIRFSLGRKLSQARACVPLSSNIQTCLPI